MGGKLWKSKEIKGFNSIGTEKSRIRDDGKDSGKE
jgi:hypothetical protein